MLTDFIDLPPAARARAREGAIDSTRAGEASSGDWGRASYGSHPLCA